MLKKDEIRYCLDTMGEMFPEAHCELVHSNPFELVIAVSLSAQCTDALVNKVTKNLFQKYKTPEDYLSVPLEELQNDIRSIGLYRNKAKNIQKLCQMVLDKYNGEIPMDRDELINLPGVGRKTANVVVSVAYNIPAIAVDTHVERVSKRLGFCRWKDSVLEVEKTLMKKVPKEEWSVTHHRMIFFGRYHCKAQNPQCEACPLLALCREGKKENEDEGDSLMANNQLDALPELIYGPFPAVKQFPSIAPDSFELMPAFLHEANYYHNKVVYQPWNKANFSECVKLVFDKWRQLKQEIQLFVKERDSNRLQQGLTIGVEYFLECLYWVNEKPVTFKNGLVDPSLEVKPFNLEDRLQFILKRLNGYHSFKQLDELYKELEKQFAIKLVRLKRSN